MAKRVRESTTSSTFLPRWQKYSAMAVAASAPRMRSSGDWSEVETTTTDRLAAFLAQRLQKLADLASALPNQPEHG